jgi:hypothetical protein
MSTISSGSSGLTWTSDNSSNLAITLTSIVDNTGNTVTGSTVVNGSAKAWVNFNPNNPVVINASYNISSVTRTGTGAFTLTFTNAMVDANYSAVLGGRAANGLMGFFVEINDTAGIVRTTTQLAVYSVQGGSFTLSDTNTKMSVAIYR